MIKKYKVIALHLGNLCNKNPRCKMYYTNEKCKDTDTHKDMRWFCNLIPYLKKLTEQVAIGSYGEPLLYPEFVKTFSISCRLNNLICNMTTNGLLIQEVDKTIIENLDMISLSFNSELIKTSKDVSFFHRNVKYLKNNTLAKVGCNLLINKEMFNSSSNNSFKEIVDYLFKSGVDNVYALYPKNYSLGIDLTKYKALYLYLTMKYDGKNGKGLFVVDDLTKEILEQGYTKWIKPCHYSDGIISISPSGEVSGCSLDFLDNKKLLKLDNPKDILKMKTIKTKLRYKCPYLIK